MNSEKKLTIVRIVIFCILAELPLAIITAAMCRSMGGPIFTGENAQTAAVSLFGMLGMCFPTLANIITRLVTGEGFGNSYISLSFRNGKWKYYLLSILVPLIYAVSGAALVILIFWKNYTGQLFDPEKLRLAPWLIVYVIGGNAACLLSYFGEEFGWRAYLVPKLTELMGEPAAVIVGGVIWGLWHAPLTCAGHNFGTDYPLFPFLGILLMCIMCICIGAFFTLITKRTGSVFPASLAHLTNNAAGASVIVSMILTDAALELEESIAVIPLSIAAFAPEIIVGLISFIILLRDNKKSVSKEKSSV